MGLKLSSYFSRKSHQPFIWNMGLNRLNMKNKEIIGSEALNL